ncbi:unnamed protein product [Heterobilharzia americana]|nr:unnamed protein product [Heterobilharzia americana]
MTITFGSIHHLRDRNFSTCSVGITESEILWKTTNESDVRIVNQISFKHFIGVTSLKIAHDMKWCGEVVKAFRKKDEHMDCGFVIWSIKQSKKCSWGVRITTFYCEDEHHASEWIDSLNNSLFSIDSSRPRSLLVFINPFCGTKRSQQIYTDQVAPLLCLAKIQTKVIVTTHRGHITDHLVENTLDSYDGVICVGGDGCLAEAVQGVLLHERPWRNRTEIKLKLGVIPAGSTDAACFSINGTNDVVTAVLHIIIGDDIGLDVVSVHADEDGTFIRYALTMLGYGFHADLLRNDDKLRWMGPHRYDYSGFKAFLQHTSYFGEVSFLPCSDPDNKSSNGTVCYCGCPVCNTDSYKLDIGSMPNNNVPTLTTTNCNGSGFSLPIGSSLHSRSRSSTDLSSTTSSLENSVQCVTNSQKIVDQSSMDSDLGQSISSNSDGRQSNLTRLSDLQSSENFFINSVHMNSCNVVSHKDGSISHSGLEQLDSISLPDCVSKSVKHGWHTIRSSFLAVNACIQSCRCARAICGPAPWAHLGDGCLDLILVRKCSQIQFLGYLMRIANNHHMTSDENPFNFPFITVQKVRAFRFVALDSHSAQHLNNTQEYSDGKQVNFDKLQNNKRKLTQSVTESSSYPCVSTIKSPFPSVCNVNRKKTSIWCCDGELIPKSNIICF